MRRCVLLGVSAVLALSAMPLAARPRGGAHDRPLRVIVTTEDAAAVERLVAAMGGRSHRRLARVPGVVVEVPRAHLDSLAASPVVQRIDADRPITGALARTAAAIGARWVQQNLGLDGNGVGVAIIDSGVNTAHDDLTTRVTHFVNFVGFESDPRDGYGHGTHVAGIIAGSGQSSDGTRRGIAPGAHLIVLKALDDQGGGHISNAIAALDYAIEQRTALNIRVINLSVAAGVHESYKTDPLTLAARRAVDAGMVVVTAAGNFGRNSNGRSQQGGITAPGNAPWVLTVGASSHNGTIDRSDDVVAGFSSMGPSAIDLVPKPDLVAPGVGIEAPADPTGTLFAARPHARLKGFNQDGNQAYLSLSGTSMAAPVVAGTVALMVQANPALSPAAVKAILQSTAEFHAGETQQGQGAGFLNARAAVELARSVAETPGAAELLDDLAELLEAEGTWSALCDAVNGDCDSPVPTCSAPACGSGDAGAIAGVSTQSQTTVWAPDHDVRRRRTGR